MVFLNINDRNEFLNFDFIISFSIRSYALSREITDENIDGVVLPYYRLCVEFNLARTDFRRTFTIQIDTKIPTLRTQDEEYTTIKGYSKTTAEQAKEQERIYKLVSYADELANDYISRALSADKKEHLVIKTIDMKEYLEKNLKSAEANLGETHDFK